MTTHNTTYRVCPLCEATCGIAIAVEDRRVTDIRGDADDPFSRGFICPKAYGLKSLYDDPDRLRTPMRKTADGWKQISWDEALSETVERLSAIRTQHGADAIGTFVGNPAVHSMHAMIYGPVLQRALGTKQRYTSSTADQMPKMLACSLMYGYEMSIPVPDIDRTQFLLILGGNPIVSNGSLMTVPDFPRRMRAVLDRGGRVVVIDPRRTETAKKASEHHFIRPGTDALFLLAMVHTMFMEQLVNLGQAENLVNNLARVRDIANAFPAEWVASRCGIPPNEIRRITRAFCAAESAACYGRIGTTCQPFGSIASWAVELVNILSGNLDRQGGAMFAHPAVIKRRARNNYSLRRGRWHSQVRKLPEIFGELPVSTLADEILQDSDRRVRAMVTLAGNPLRSAPNSERLTRAFESLEFMVSVDLYCNETTSHADIILPPPSPIERDSYDLALYRMAVRNVAKYSPAAVPKPDDQPDEWEILLTIAKGLMGQVQVPVIAADDVMLAQLVPGQLSAARAAAQADGDTRLDDLTPQEILTALGDTRGPSRILDLMLRLGPYGDYFGRQPDGLSLTRLRDTPHGVDLGALTPRLPEVLRTEDHRIELAPALLIHDIERLKRSLDDPTSGTVLIGRRHLRSNNSWMHNLMPLVKGKERCTLLVNPRDAAHLGLQTGDRARLDSAVGSVVAPVEVTDDMMEGVVSLPHGWGHDGDRMQIAREHAGVNVNMLSDDTAIDVPSGNAAFNGVPVTVAPAS